jgi:hypothetical protein
MHELFEIQCWFGALPVLAFCRFVYVNGPSPGWAIRDTCSVMFIIYGFHERAFRARFRSCCYASRALMFQASLNADGNPPYLHCDSPIWGRQVLLHH